MTKLRDHYRAARRDFLTARYAARAAELRAAAAEIGRYRVADVMEGYYDPDNYVDPRDYLYERGRRPQSPTGLRVNYSSISDREEGRNYPIFQTEQELSLARGMSRALVEVNPEAKGAVRTLTNYVVKRGFQYRVVSASKKPTEFSRTGQLVIDAFLDRNRWCGDLDRELFARTERDGEYFLGLWHVGGGDVEARVIEPECVTEPGRGADVADYVGADPDASSWTFGVHTEKDDVCCRHGYYVQWDSHPTSWDYIPGGQDPFYPPGKDGENAWCLHAKINTDRNIKRGLTSFFANNKNLELARKLLRNLGEGASVQSAIAFFREHAGGVSKSKITEYLASKATRSNTHATAAGSKTTYTERYEPGTVVDHGVGVTYKPAALGGNNAAVFTDIIAALLQSAASIWSIPLHMLTGTGDGTNYASILSVDAPFTRACESSQWHLVQCDLEILWKVLYFAWVAGRFGDVSWETVEDELEIQVSPPDVAVRDRDKETNRRDRLFTRGIISPATYAAEEGYDLQQERIGGAKPLGEDPTLSPPASTPETPRATDETRNPLMKGEESGIDPVPSQVSKASSSLSESGIAAAVTEQDIQVATELVLNGAQITAATAIVTAVATGQIPRDAGVRQLEVLFNLTNAQAEKIMGSAGTAKPTVANPKPANAADAAL